MAIKPGTKRSRRAFRRRPGNLSGRRVLVVCEGEETEPGYFEALRKHLRLGAMVVIAGKECGSAPISVVDYAIHEKEQAERARDQVRFDAVWVVFDRDGHESFSRAIDKANAHDISIAYSIPCFEFWLLLHVHYTTRPYGKCEDLKKDLEARIDANDSRGRAAQLAEQPEKRAQAVRNAKKVRHHHDASSNGPYPNPSTDVDRLIAFLEALLP